MDNILEVCFQLFLNSNGALPYTTTNSLISELDLLTPEHQIELLKNIKNTDMLKKMFVSFYEIQHYDLCQSIKDILNTKGIYCN